MNVRKQVYACISLMKVLLHIHTLILAKVENTEMNP